MSYFFMAVVRAVHLEHVESLSHLLRQLCLHFCHLWHVEGCLLSSCLTMPRVSRLLRILLQKSLVLMVLHESILFLEAPGGEADGNG